VIMLLIVNQIRPIQSGLGLGSVHPYNADLRINYWVVRIKTNWKRLFRISAYVL